MVSVQVERWERQAVVLIIRRSWVRAPPAPPAITAAQTCIRGISVVRVRSTVASRKQRERGSIETPPSDSLRVKVYAAIDPLTKNRLYLDETVPAGSPRL